MTIDRSDAWSSFKKGYKEAKVSETAKALAIFIGGVIGTAVAAAYLD